MKIIEYKNEDIFINEGYTRSFSMKHNENELLIKHDLFKSDVVFRELIANETKSILGGEAQDLGLIRVNDRLLSTLWNQCNFFISKETATNLYNYFLTIKKLPNRDNLGDVDIDLFNILNTDEVIINLILDLYLLNSDSKNRGNNILINNQDNHINFIDYDRIFGDINAHCLALIDKGFNIEAESSYSIYDQLMANSINSYDSLHNLKHLRIENEQIYTSLLKIIKIDNIHIYIEKLRNKQELIVNNVLNKLPSNCKTDLLTIDTALSFLKSQNRRLDEIAEYIEYETNYIYNHHNKKLIYK